MKRFLLFIFIPLFFGACSQDDSFLEEFETDAILRCTEVDACNSHLGFTSIAGNADRSRIVLVYRDGSAHASFDGELIQVESFDEGNTWQNRQVIYQTDGTDARDPQLFVHSNGQLLCRFFERASESSSTVRCLLSDNFGVTYDNISSFPFPTSSETFAAARGNMVEIDGTIYTVCYNRWAQSWWVKSDDQGKTWEVVSWVDETLGTQQNSLRRIGEASLGYQDGKIYMVARAEGDDSYMQIGTSTDLGETWTCNILPIKGQAPSMTPYNGGFILTYRLVNVVNKSYDFQIAYLKNGRVLGTPVSLFRSESMDIGYGDALTLPTSFLVCCYQPNKIKCYEISYDIFDE